MAGEGWPIPLGNCGWALLSRLHSDGLMVSTGRLQPNPRTYKQLVSVGLAEYKDTGSLKVLRITALGIEWIKKWRKHQRAPDTVQRSKISRDVAAAKRKQRRLAGANV